MNDRLELSHDEMTALGYRVVDTIVEHFTTLGNKHVGRKADALELTRTLAEPIPKTGKSADDILIRLETEVLSNILNLGHPRFFAFVPGPSNFISVMADVMASGFNVFNGTWLGGSGAAGIEVTVIDWLRQLCGFPETAGGLFVSGGSMASVTALTVARHVKLCDRTRGAKIYCSDQTHFSVERALRVIGFLPNQIEYIPSDSSFRLPLAALQDRVEQDRADGLRPFCVIANAGTTSTGAIDPLNDIAMLCRSRDLWMHVDGAYGAAAVITKRGRMLLEGIELADSLSLDPHKWLFQSIECGCVLLRDAKLLKATFRAAADYLSEIHRESADINLCDYGIQLTRSFRSLKLWMSLQYFGLDAFTKAIERGFFLAEIAERRLRQLPHWEIVTPAELGIVSFRRRGAGETYYRRLHEAMLADGFALLSSTVLKGRTALRLCAINPRTTEEEVEKTIDWIDGLIPVEENGFA